MVQRSIAPFAGTASPTSAPGNILTPIRSRPVVQLREQEPRILQRAALASAGLAPAVIQRSPSDDVLRTPEESPPAPTESVIEQRAQPEVQAMAHASADDLAETVRRVEALGRHIVAGRADVRDPASLAEVLGDGVTRLGHLDIVSANAGIGSSPCAAEELA